MLTRRRFPTIREWSNERGQVSAVVLTLYRRSGYTDPVFEGKAEQASQVKAMLKERGFIPPDLAEGEVDWFYQ